ncbi:MAG: hypothetical protein MPN21_05945 [Thermoanaerobaculia bacterium]|nr:hypothetical protein [Thermoanaerobaculia bacterium]
MSTKQIHPKREKSNMRFQGLRATIRLVLVLLALALWGCDEPLQENDAGGIALTVEFQSAPTIVGVNDQNRVTIGQMNIDSIAVNPDAGISSLMDVEISTMEVTYTRADTGTRVPVPYVVQLLGTVPADGTLTYSNIPVLGIEQMRAEPLSDLLFENGAVDKETGNDYIRLNVNVRVFGRTRGGEEVASRLRGETVEFVPSLVTSF